MRHAFLLEVAFSYAFLFFFLFLPFSFDLQYATGYKLHTFLYILLHAYKEIVFYITEQNVSEGFFLKNKYKMIAILDSFKFPSAVKKTVKFKMKKSDIQIF